MSDLYFDPKEFDFTSLSDVVVMDEEPQEKRTQHKEPVPFSDDISDLVGYSEDDEPEESEVDFNDDATDLVRDDIQGSFNATQILESIADNAVFDLDGVQLTKAQVKELAKAKSKIEDDNNFFSNQSAIFASDNEVIKSRALMQQTVLENNISILRNRLNNPNLPDHEYADTSRKLETANNSLYQLTQEVNQIMQKRYEQENAINGYRIRSADQQMANDYPTWNEQKSDILNFIVNDMGVPVTTLEKVYDKGFMKLALDAYRYNLNKKRVAEQAEQATKSRTPRSLNGAKTSTRNNTVNEYDAAKAKRVLSRMGNSRQDNVAAFNFIKD